MQFQNGICYEGEFNCNKIHGSGSLYWTDGSIYIGNVSLGIRNGKGRFISASKDIIYDGFWSNGKREGYGKLELADGSVYEGQFKNDMKHGEGKIVYKSGNFYDGNWMFNKKAGYGVMNWILDKEKYSGSWCED